VATGTANLFMISESARSSGLMPRRKVSTFRESPSFSLVSYSILLIRFWNVCAVRLLQPNHRQELFRADDEAARPDRALVPHERSNSSEPLRHMRALCIRSRRDLFDLAGVYNPRNRWNVTERPKLGHP
jgi:hypothetical protein